MKILLEDLFDEIGSDAVNRDSSEIISREFSDQFYALFTYSKQKTSFFFGATVKKEDDPEVVREYIDEKWRREYSKTLYILKVIMHRVSFAENAQFFFEIHKDRDYNSPIMSVPADELLETGRDGRPECSRIWDDWDFCNEMHIAFRANFVPNPFITFRSFVKDMGYINSRIIDTWTSRNCELRKKEPDGEAVSVYSFRMRVKRLSDVYAELTGNNVDESESESEREFEESHSANSQYVQYLIFFEKSNARKLKSGQTDYNFRMRGYNVKTISINTSILYLTVIADPVDNDYSRSRLYDFLIDRLVAPLNRFSNGRNQTAIEIFVYDSGPYTAGLRKNPDVVTRNFKINGNDVEVDVTFINQNYQIYPAGRVRTFHRDNDAFESVFKWPPI